jgi:hypothetical protein
MDYQRREWLMEWGGASIVASIADDLPDLQISDGANGVDLLRYCTVSDPTDPGNENNLHTIRVLVEVLSEFHSAYLAALHPDCQSG